MCHGNTATAMFFGEVIYVVVRDADNRPILLFRYEDVLSIWPHPDQISCCNKNNSPPIYFACPWYIYAATVVMTIKGTHAQTFKRSAKLHQVVMLHGALNNTVLPGDCKRANLMEKALLEELLLSCIEPKTGLHPGKVHRPNNDTLLHNPGLITVTPDLV